MKYAHTNMHLYLPHNTLRASGTGPVGQAKTGPLSSTNLVMIVAFSYKCDLHECGNDRHDIHWGTIRSS